MTILKTNYTQNKLQKQKYKKLWKIPGSRWWSGSHNNFNNYSLYHCRVIL